MVDSQRLLVRAPCHIYADVPVMWRLLVDSERRWTNDAQRMDLRVGLLVGRNEPAN